MLVKERVMGLEHWEKLISILEEQSVLYGEFLKLLEEKESYLVKGNTKKLGDIVRREEKIIIKLEAVEALRMDVIAQVADGARDFPLREILDKAPEAVRDRLEGAAGKLVDLLTHIALKNHSNAELIGESLNFIEYQINLLSSSGRRTENIYEGSGRLRSSGEPPSSGILNKQV